MSRVMLYCLPHAGAGAATFNRWPAFFGADFGMDLAVEAVRLPGREARIGEDPTPDPVAIAARVASRVDGAYAIFGHSMGALLGFETVRELRRLGAPMPLRLFVSAARPPGSPLDMRYSPLPDDELLTAVTAMGGMPEEIASHAELRELILPILRADFAWLEDYRPAEEDPLAVPIVGFCGDSDATSGPELMAGWAWHTAAGYRQFTFAGGHFYLESQLAAVASLISSELKAPARLP